MHRIGKKVDVSGIFEFCWNVFGFEFTIHLWRNKTITRHRHSFSLHLQFLWWTAMLAVDWGKRDYKRLREITPLIRRERSITSNGVNL